MPSRSKEKKMSDVILVTGANRGIGLAVTKVFLSEGDRVFAACRDPKKAVELQELKKNHPQNLDLVEYDANSDKSVEAAAKEVAKKTDHLDVLINMAGIMLRPHDAKLEDLDFAQCRETFETNVLGPLRGSKFFLPLLRKSNQARIVNVTSGLGSISGTDNPHFYAYGASKSALNKVTRTLALELKPDNIVAVALDPGWVKTDMGGPNAWLTPEESSSAIVKTVKNLKMEQTSLFIHNDGKVLSW
jgi:NAD(P)-dependent dehydrogenase (short-subunit alcohol dehydrogenase family)